MTARLISVQVGKPRSLKGPKPWKSAFHKLPVVGPCRISKLNLEGDRQADLRVHGGPDQAVLCYAAAHYPDWSRSLGFPLPYGGFGENFTIHGLDEWSTCIGDVYAIGDAVLQVTQPRGPCFKIGYRWGIPDLLKQVTENQRSGWYLRVLEEGTVEAGLEIRVAERPNPDWTVNRAARAWDQRNASPGEADRLLACEGLAVKHRARLEAFVRRA